jgi:undecaprenyl-diphosphatase
MFALDYEVTQFIFDNIIRAPFLDEFFIALSLVGYYKFVWLCIFVVWAITLKRVPKAINVNALLIILCVVGISLGLKEVVNRPRPCVQPYFAQVIQSSNISARFASLGYNNCLTDASFPSLHTSLAFTIATIFAFYFKKYKKIVFSIAFLVGFSRIYLGQHFLLDVMFGAFIGYMVSVYLLKVFTNKSAP